MDLFFAFNAFVTLAVIGSAWVLYHDWNLELAK
jgi:hypothetical protein